VIDKNCENCFYGDYPVDAEPCGGCTANSMNGKDMYSKWVAVDVFKNIDNKHGEAMVQRVIHPTTGIKYDNDKPQWSLLPFKALKEVVDVLTYGAKKYAPDNWKKVPNAKQRYIDAGFRHFTAYAAGEKLDPETGKSHLAHALCCLLYLLAFEIGEDRG
jgi:hypothetical protein